MLLRYALSETINNRNNFCSLCFGPVLDPIYVRDKISLNDNKSDKSIDCLTVLQIVLGNEIANNLSLDNAICVICRTTTIDCYKFIKCCKERRDLFSVAIDSITNCLDQSEPIASKYKSVYFTLQPKEDIKQVYYDCLGIGSDGTKAILRLNTIVQSIKRENINLATGLPEEDNLQCDLCPKSFANAHRLSMHKTRIHAPKGYQCSQCPRSYGSEVLKAQHEDRAHNKLVCSVCGKWLTKFRMPQHILTHKPNTEIMCQFCGRIFKGNHTYKRHKCVNKETHYECDYCHKKLLTKRGLKYHIAFYHLNIKDCVCFICNKSYCNQLRLRYHMITHNSAVRSTFTCDYCGDNFSSSNGLLYHTRLHTGEKPFKCSKCDLWFLSASRRADHFRRTHREPLFNCEVCNEKFKYRFVLTRHMKTHVSKIDNIQVVTNEN